MQFFFSCFLCLRSTLYKKRNAACSHSWVHLSSTTSALYQAYQSPSAQRTHTHARTHIQADMRKAMYIYTLNNARPNNARVSLPAQVSFVCKMKARPQNASKGPARSDRAAATCSTNAVFGQLKKRQ